MQDCSNDEQLGSASIALSGSLILYFVLPFLFSLALGFVLFTLPNVCSKAPAGTRPPRLAPTAIHASAWLQGKLIPAPLRSDSLPPIENRMLLEVVRRGFVYSVGFVVYYGCFATVVFLMLFRLVEAYNRVPEFIIADAVVLKEETRPSRR